MAEAVEFSILGLDSVLGKLDTVGQDVRYKGGRFALRKAAQLIRNAARENAKRIDDPETPADISLNIVERWGGRRFKATGDLLFRVGIMGGAGGSKTAEEQSSLPGGDTRHWRYLEFGTQDMPAQPFFRRAMEENINAATAEFIDQYDKALGRAIRRAQKKAARQ